MKLLVSTKRGLPRRRRGGEEFTLEAKVVEVNEENGAAILGDDALNATLVSDDYKPGDVPKLDTAAIVKLTAENKEKDETITKLEAKVAELEAKLAASTPSTGERERTATKAK